MMIKMIHRQLLLPKPPNKLLLHPIIATSFFVLYYILCQNKKVVHDWFFVMLLNEKILIYGENGV